MYRVALAVTNDIVTDNRINKVALTLMQNGFLVTVVGIKFNNSLDLFDRKYNTRRFRMTFTKGPFFYIFYNLRLFFYLSKSRPDIVVANDLDTLLGSFLAAKILRRPILIDFHEYYTELPELVHRPVIRNIWKLLEKILVPHVNLGYTVSETIAQRYNKSYNIDLQVIRNVGWFKYEHDFSTGEKEFSSRIIIYQGVLNLGRGLELMIEAMQYLEDCRLWLMGSGDIEQQLTDLVNKLNLNDRVIFHGRIPLEELWEYTQQGNVGISLEEDLGLNYRYALPNKLFDYIQARIPVLVSDLPEMKKLVLGYKIGLIAEKRTPEDIADYINDLISAKDSSGWKQNLELAARELCWQREEDKLIDIYREATELVSMRIS